MTKSFVEKIILVQACGIPSVEKMILSTMILSLSYYVKPISNP